MNEATAQVTGARARGSSARTSPTTSPSRRRRVRGTRQVFAKGAVTDYPLTIRHRDSKLTDVLYNASVYKDARGNVLGVFAAARDVTAQKQASQYARSLDRGLARPARHHQPGGQDHRRERGDHQGRPASRARSSSGRTSPTTSPSRRRRARATSRCSPRVSSPTTRSPSATGTGASRTCSTTRRCTRTCAGTCSACSPPRATSRRRRRPKRRSPSSAPRSSSAWASWSGSRSSPSGASSR